MKKLLISVAVFAFAIASFAQAPGYEFTTVVSHKATPVKDQSSTGTCCHCIFYGVGTAPHGERRIRFIRDVHRPPKVHEPNGR